MDDRVLQSASRLLATRPEVHLALAFGSRARGTARSDSDLDIAVNGDDLDLLALMRDLSMACGVEVEVVDLGEAGYPLQNALLRDSVLLHEGRPGAAARWRSHTIASVETDRAWWERMRDAYLRLAASGPH